MYACVCPSYLLRPLVNTSPSSAPFLMHHSPCLVMCVNVASQLFQGLSPEEVCERWPSWRDNCNVLFTLGFNVEDITTILLKVRSAAPCPNHACPLIARGLRSHSI